MTDIFLRPGAATPSDVRLRDPTLADVTATASITEADDSLVATTTVLVSASASIAEAADSVASTTTVLVSASAAIAEAADSVASTTTVIDSASEASTEADDSVVATVTTSISASASITEADDSLVALVGVAGGTMAGGGTRGGSYNRREVDRAFREYLKKQRRRDEQVAAELANQPKVASIAALVDHHAKAAVLTDTIKANDDEEAIMVLLLAA